MNIIKLLLALALSASGAAVQSASTTLDFSSGSYNAANTLYTQDGYNVFASHGFHTVKLGTLAWYEGDNTITLSASGGLFNLDQLTVVSPAYAGLSFQSSNGGLMTVGSITGVLSFPGSQWDAVSYVTISSITRSDILSQLDNIILTPVSEPSGIWLLISGLGVFGLVSKRSRSRYSAV